MLRYLTTPDGNMSCTFIKTARPTERLIALGHEGIT